MMNDHSPVADGFYFLHDVGAKQYCFFPAHILYKWPDFQKLVGNTWAPGKNVPFDPVASEYAAKIRLRVIVAAGRKIENLKKILTGSDFEGTIIGLD